jgi:ADP-ribose pyrophosphatase YjhB (NUDIX family)
MSKLMVVGIIFAGSQVLLIKKERPKNYKGVGRPENQVGMYNGVGGVVLDTETAMDCLIRKTLAETGLTTVAANWIPFHEVQSADGTTILFAKCAMTPAQMTKAKSPTDEAVALLSADKLAAYQCVSNIPWLVAMARDNSHNYSVSEDATASRVEAANVVTLQGTAWTSMGTTPAPVTTTTAAPVTVNPAPAAQTAQQANTTVAGGAAAPAQTDSAGSAGTTSENNAGGAISGNASGTTSETASTSGSESTAGASTSGSQPAAAPAAEAAPAASTSGNTTAS